MITYNNLLKKTKYMLLMSLLFGFYVQGQELEVLINEGLSNNPEVQKYELQYQIAAEKLNEIHTFSNTEIGVGYFVSEPETRTGAQKARVSIKQMFPWFGTITARGQYATAMADVQFEEIAIAKRKLMLAISQGYYKLYVIKAKKIILLKNIELLETYEQLALTSVEVGKASAVDVLRLQMRQNELDQTFKLLEQDDLAEQTILNNLMNRGEFKTIEVMDDFKIPIEDPFMDSDSLQIHPELIKYDKLYASVEQSELLNQKDSAPLFGLGVDYIAVAERPDMNFNDNGKDILMPMVTLTIPIFNSKFKSISKQNEFKQQEINSQKQERVNSMKSMLETAIRNRNSARISFNTQTKNLKQANDAEEILIKNYETGTIDFNDVLDIQELQLKFEINQVESIKNYFMQSTIISYLTNQNRTQ